MLFFLHVKQMICLFLLNKNTESQIHDLKVVRIKLNEVFRTMRKSTWQIMGRYASR